MKPLKKKKKRDFPKLAVFDIESTEWTKVRVIAHVDEYGNRKIFRNVPAYLRWLFTHFEGDCVWSHFGSGYDNRFLIDVVQRWKGTSYKAIMSGGQPIIFSVQNSEYTVADPRTGKERERRISLLDSFRLLPSSLAKIGESLGKPKKDVDRSRIEQLEFHEVAEYCLSDCDILLAGLQRFRDTIEAEGGMYSPTSASIASNFIRADARIDWRQFFEPGSEYQSYSGQFYEEGRPGSKPGMIQADEFCMSAYYGGRCEVFRPGRHDGPLYLYDIASAYPWAMRQELPLYFKGFQVGASWEQSAKLVRILKSCGVSDAYVTIPTGRLPFPVLPVHAPDGKVVFAEGMLHGRWTNAELYALYKRRIPGLRIDVTSWAKFEAVAFAREFVDTFYAKRREAKEAGDEAQSMIYKILLNACYGKLAQQLEQSVYVFGPAYEWMRMVAEDEGRLLPTITAGVHEIKETSDGVFRHVAAGAYVTALARLKLLEGLELAHKQGARVYYCDTDSIIVDRQISGWGGSTELGSWELENTLTDAEFLCPKVYRATGKKGLLLKAKGSNLKSQLPNKSPEHDHEHERLMRWAVYAAEISPWASDTAAQLTAEERAYYGHAESGLVGWRSSVKAGKLEPTVQEIKRRARHEDNKRVHLGHGRTVPRVMDGHDRGHADVRLIDEESLIEMELIA